MSRKHFKRLFCRYYIKQTGLNGYVYDFSFDYNVITVDDILDIQKYLRKKNGVLQNSWIY